MSGTWQARKAQVEKGAAVRRWAQTLLSRHCTAQGKKQGLHHRRLIPMRIQATLLGLGIGLSAFKDKTLQWLLSRC